MQGQIVDIFSVFFSAMFPLMLVLFFVVFIFQLFNPKWLSRILGFEHSTTGKSTPEKKPEKVIMECYSCSQSFKKNDVFCGYCGNEL